jgi:hypothetical protein
MAEDAAAPVSDLEQQEEQQQEAVPEQAEEAGLKKRERGDDEDEQEPTAKRPNHNVRAPHRTLFWGRLLKGRVC